MEPAPPVIRLTSQLLIHASNLQAEIVLTRDFDFSVLPDGVSAAPELFSKMTRRLKVMCGMNPWPESPVEHGEIYIKLNEKPLRYAITFDHTKGRERTTILAPTVPESWPSGDEMLAAVLLRKAHH